MGGGSFDAFWAENYPIQYRVREFCLDVSIWFSAKRWRFREKVLDRLFPKNKWIRSVIPNHYSDKPELIKDVLFASIVDFVEVENKNLRVDWYSDKKDRKIWQQVKECYDFIVRELPVLEKRVDDLLTETYYSDEEKSKKNQIRDLFADGMGPVDEKKQQIIWDTERDIEKKTQDVLRKIIDVRMHLWT